MHKSIACIASLAIFIAGCAHDQTVPPQAQAPQSACVAGPPIDLERYMGRWYVIADTPFLSESDYVGSYDEWTLRSDGSIDDKYLGRRHGFDQPATGSQFVAKVMSGTGNTKWRVGLIWPFEVVVVTAYVDPDYRYTIRCMADGNMLWVLARAPVMDDATYAGMLARLAAMGFNTDRLRRVPQTAGQVGQPDFQ
ncbi:bacterial lipocalin [Burkholderia sp. Ch1-1]|uniref:Outer membrane lipoprotein Blc n=1 Tax=Paraburkholderia dioscoreae TaxID=2604047 RepID=A0A5Q4YVK1_9BURK|nr:MULTISPECIES: lipocalin family protein [Paraburkholderia]EIF30842.1 bacterial lipocalin [Burkholderia sp. Ch1-1]MDR8398499.1 lipocalin family protein [Paraburkholderia sp. USG1]VVD28918.1 Outer membrane lipoprotein Blc [Paraburkholderia dioscoreae]